MTTSTPWASRRRAQGAPSALWLLAAALSLLAACGDTARTGPGRPDSGGADEGPLPPLSSSGRWFTDAAGRTVLFHGFNEVAKSPPFYPAAFGFGEDDAAFLAREGFNMIRLGVDFRGLMPAPGEIDEDYIGHLRETAHVLARHRIFVLLDFHQDGFAPLFNGNGLPDWMAITDGLPNPPEAVFPLYYVQNPAMQRAFEHFWANSPGPGGVGLQDYFVQGVEQVVAAFADDPWVIGYELMNEPWPGADWGSCVEPGGCAALEQRLLVPFQRRVGGAARAIAPDRFVFVEPFVLFNFGRAPTTLPGRGPGLALSFHSYAIDEAGEEAVLRLGASAAERDGAPVLVTEFGATTDARKLDRLAGQMERNLLPWLDWSYDESIIADHDLPASPGNLRRPAAFDALVRPYPVAITGTPTALAFDLESKTLDFAYDAWSRDPGDLTTVVHVPSRHYPAGYAVAVDGAGVTSAPCAEHLTLRNTPGARRVRLRLTPSPAGCP